MTLNLARTYSGMLIKELEETVDKVMPKPVNADDAGIKIGVLRNTMPQFINRLVEVLSEETVDKVMPKKPVKGSELTNQQISDAVIRDLQTRAGCDRRD